MKIPSKKQLFCLTSMVFFFIGCSSEGNYSSYKEPTEVEITRTPPPSKPKAVGAWCYNPNYSGYCSFCRNIGPGEDSQLYAGCRLLNTEDRCQSCGI